MEYTTNRAEAFGITGCLAPRRQQDPEIFDFVLEFFDEDFADFIVDIIFRQIELKFRTNGQIGLLRVGRVGARPRTDLCRIAGFQLFLKRHGKVVIVCGLLLRSRRFEESLVGILDVVAQRGHRRFGGLGRQRPVAQRFQALLGNRENVFTIGAFVAQGFEVVLDTGNGVGERIQLLAAGHAALLNELVLGEEANTGNVVRALRQFQHPERTRNFIQQSRHFRQCGVIPACFHKCNECLACITEVHHGFARERREQLFGIRRADGFLTVAASDFASQLGHLIFQGRIHEQQGTRDVEQNRFVSRLVAVDNTGQQITLPLDEIACAAESQHAERVGDAAQCIHFVSQVVGIGVAGTQMQVQRIFDPEDVFFQRASHRVQQGTVDAGDAALRMRKLFGTDRLLMKSEGVAKSIQAGVGRINARDLLQKLAHGQIR